MPEVLGVVLVRNEDRFLARALANAANFCDRFLLFDNGSSDRSREILSDFAGSHRCAAFHSIANPAESQEILRKEAGKPLWVFGVDGDEIYDPERLAAFKGKLLSGEFDSQWMVMGHALHVDEFNEEQRVVRGYAAPPSRSITKLFNFAAISDWPGRSMERLHGGTPNFRHGYDASRKRLLFQESSWEDSPLRCLHMCFCRRSSVETPGNHFARLNIDELYNGRMPAWALRLLARWRPSAWKRERYRRGERITLGTTPFFP